VEEEHRPQSEAGSCGSLEHGLISKPAKEVELTIGGAKRVATSSERGGRRLSNVQRIGHGIRVKDDVLDRSWMYRLPWLWTE
jgi:hypothetical protein